VADVTLTRTVYTPTGTLGVIHDETQAYCLTLEDPWNQNKKNISCIPTGLYRVVPHSGTRFKNVWKLLDVPGRADILIHAGNTQANTEGCILLGTSFVPDGAHIAWSQIAIDAMRGYWKAKFNNEFTLLIRDFQSQSAGQKLVHTKPNGPTP
jgi:hypothetical protein